MGDDELEPDDQNGNPMPYINFPHPCDPTRNPLFLDSQYQIYGLMKVRAHRATIRLPVNPAHRPDQERLAWHVEGRFRG